MFRPLHIALAFAVLLSTTGVVFSQHSCGDLVRSTAIFAKATPCEHAEKKAAACPFHAAASATEEAAPKGCCNDKVQLTKADKLLDLVPAIAIIQAPVALLVRQVSFAQVTEPASAKTWAARHYRPPPEPAPDLTALQVFRC